MRTAAAELQSEVLNEIRQEPSVDIARVGVAVERGVVTLTGQVRTLAERQTVEAAAKRVRGVTAVANELLVDLLDEHVRGDVEIANAAVDALRWHVNVPEERIKVAVAKGWVTLTGEVPAYYQRSAAESAVLFLTGVRGVTNSIVLKPTAKVRDVRHQLAAPLHRYAQVEAEGIEVLTEGDKVTLNGRVHTWAERDLVQGAAWRVPGIAHVDNRLLVSG
jgi:osmotically-inducible protein OsmY